MSCAPFKIIFFHKSQLSILVVFKFKRFLLSDVWLYLFVVFYASSFANICCVCLYSYFHVSTYIEKFAVSNTGYILSNLSNIYKKFLNCTYKLRKIKTADTTVYATSYYSVQISWHNSPLRLNPFLWVIFRGFHIKMGCCR